MLDTNVIISLNEDTKTYVTRTLWMTGAVAVVVIGVYFLFKKA